MHTPTRQDYMQARCTFAEYYSAVAKTAGVRFSAKDRIVQDAARSSDPHYNDIPLRRWDAIAASIPALGAAFQSHGDFYSLAGAVCVAKQAVRNAVEALRVTQ